MYIVVGLAKSDRAPAAGEHGVSGIVESDAEIQHTRMTRGRLVPGNVDRLSARSRLVTSVRVRKPRGRPDMVGNNLRWHGGLLLRTRSSYWRPIFLEVAVGARIIHKDVHQDG